MMFSRAGSRFTLHLDALLLPGILAALFVIQTDLFNEWVGLTSYFFIRRTIVACGQAALIFGIAALLGPKLKLAYLGVVELAFGLLFTAEYLYFKVIGAFLQPSAIRYASYAVRVSSIAASKIDWKVVSFFLGLLLVLGAALLHWRGPARRPVTLRVRLQLAAGALAISLLGYGYLALREYQAWGDLSRLHDHPFDNAELIKKVGITNYAWSGLTKLALQRRGITDDERQFLVQWAKSRPPGAPSDHAHGAARGRNIIFVQLESYQSWLIGRELGGKELTPNLNALVRESLYFPNYFYLVGPGTTADAEFTTLNSLYPPADGVAFFEYPTNHYESLLHVLGDHGYTAVAYHADARTFWNRSAIYPALGYQTYFDADSYVHDERINWGLSDGSFFRQTAEKLRALPQPFFATVITLSTHSPFTLPPEMNPLPIPPELQLTEEQVHYIQAAHYADAALGEFVAQLRASGLWEQSVLVVDGDHQSFTVKKDDHNVARMLGLEAFDDLSYLRFLQVPLLIHVPGLPGERIDAPGSHLDLAPTLLNLAGIAAPASALGQDLLNSRAPVVVKRRGPQEIEALITSQHIYLNMQDGTFEHGSCTSATSNARLELEACRPEFEAQLRTLRASDLAVRGDALSILRCGTAGPGDGC